jgi:hypothetical protein
MFPLERGFVSVGKGDREDKGDKGMDLYQEFSEMVLVDQRSTSVTNELRNLC